MGKIIVWQRKIAVHSPILAPRVTDDKVAVLLFVTDHKDSVPAPRFLSPSGYGRTTGALNLFGFEAVVDSETDDKWKAGGETNFHVRKLSR